MNNTQILTVSQLTSSIKKMLEGRFAFISVAGEISNLRRPASGHCYFTLKDDRAQIRAVLFKTQLRYLEKTPRDGQMVVCRGRISVYEPRGDYQLIVDTLDFQGAGALQLAYERLKKKLAAEGLFDASVKKMLPALPEHLTPVTSPTGAAVHDFIRIAATRYPRLKIAIYPVTVQGEGAAKELCRAIVDINAHGKTDGIILCRGGGSIEDLWAFNNEKLAREIRRSTLPVVSAVGHEIDFTIADFAADLRAPTPSGAAEMLLPDQQVLADQVASRARRLYQSIQARLDRAHDRLALVKQLLAGAAHPVDTVLLRLDHAANRLNHAMENILLENRLQLIQLDSRLLQSNLPATITQQQQIIRDINQKLHRGIREILRIQDENLSRSSGLLHAVSPLSTLARGYAIAGKKKGQGILTSADQVRIGEEIEIILHQGRLSCTVRDKRPNNREGGKNCRNVEQNRSDEISGKEIKRES